MFKKLPEETADIRASGRTSNPELCLFLNKKGCNVFTSQMQVRRVEEERLAPLRCDKIERGFLMLKQPLSGEEMQKHPCAEV